MGVLGAGQAQAVGFVDVSVAGHIWRVTTFTGTYNDNSSKFNTPAAGGEMPWWGSKELAGQFALAGWPWAHFPNNECPLDVPTCGPYFAHSIPHPGNPLNGNDIVTYTTVFTDIKGLTGNDAPRDSQTTLNPTLGTTTRTWAQATKVPGPLPALGLAAAFGYSRKLRKRIKSTEPEVISTTAV
jgi:hypothetical protein